MELGNPIQELIDNPIINPVYISLRNPMYTSLRNSVYELIVVSVVNNSKGGYSAKRISDSVNNSAWWLR